jgi:hypothetical protein
MAAKKDTTLDHVLFVRGGYGSTYEKRGAGGLDLLLLAGVPEPVANIDPDFLPALIADGVVVPCTEKGRTEEGKLHPSMKAPIDIAAHDAGVAQAEAEQEAMKSGTAEVSAVDVAPLLVVKDTAAEG